MFKKVKMKKKVCILDGYDRLINSYIRTTENTRLHLAQHDMTIKSTRASSCLKMTIIHKKSPLVKI
jgi:hypothetical protein